MVLLGRSANDKLYNRTLATSNPCKKPTIVPSILLTKLVPELILAINLASQIDAPYKIPIINRKLNTFTNTGFSLINFDRI